MSYDSEQQENLDRVSARIGRAILEFFGRNQEFFADELRKSVTQQVGAVAPGSADRVMRDLRQKGIIDYRCVSRSQSKYKVLRAGELQRRLF